MKQTKIFLVIGFTFFCLLAAVAKFLGKEKAVSKTKSQIPVQNFIQKDIPKLQSHPTTTSQNSQKDSEVSFYSENHLAQIIANDDICKLTNEFKNHMAEYSKNIDLIEQTYFEKSQFRDQYLEIKNAFKGQEPQSRFASLTYHLAQAGLLSSNELPKDFDVDFEKAQVGFQELERQDPGNAALVALQIANSEDLDEETLQNLINKLNQADRFDTYNLSFLEDLASADGPSAVGYMIKVGYKSKMPTADWFEIRSQLKDKLKRFPDALERIGWLMAQNGLNSQKPSDSLGFDIMEYSLARSILNSSTQLPTYVEIDNRFPGPRYDDESLSKLMKLSESCNPEMAQDMRNHILALRSHGAAFGLR